MPDAALSPCEISVVIPAYNEADSLPELLPRLQEVLSKIGRRHEILVVDDGSDDGTFDVLAKLAAGSEEIHGLAFSRNYGKAAALAAGFREAQGEIVITMDADLQDDPAEIPHLIAEIDRGFDLVSGWKQKRKDSFIKNQTSRVFNAVTSLLSGLKLHDFNCGLKAYRAAVTSSLRLYGELHRFIPALAHREGFKVGEIPVRHHARRYGQTKYGTARFLNGFLDLLTVLFLHTRSASPLHLFGRIGLFFFLIGAIINAYFLVHWLTGHGLRLRPLLLFGVVLIVMAIQFVSLGLIAELVVSGRQPEAEYRVRRRI